MDPESPRKTIFAQLSCCSGQMPASSRLHIVFILTSHIIVNIIVNGTPKNKQITEHGENKSKNVADSSDEALRFKFPLNRKKNTYGYNQAASTVLF